jgi:hypothetical protein
MTYIRVFKGMFNNNSSGLSHSAKAATVARSLISTNFPATLRGDFEARQRDG